MTASNAKAARQRRPAPIGGFFEQGAPQAATGGQSVLDAWTQGRPYIGFVNARSAFASLVELHRDATIWLPAFLCGDLAQPTYASRTRFYPVLDGFEPDLTSVAAEARTGDLVLVIAYFGLPVSRQARQVLEQRGDLHIVEDRAHALGPGLDAAMGWQLYSPRKLLGVADGGLLVAPNATAFIPRPTGPANSEALWAAPRLRQADPVGRHNARWHAANQAKEAAMTVTSEAITELSLSIVASTPLDSLALPRLENWRSLDARLRTWSALAPDPPTPPLGYVLRLVADQRDRLLQHLHAERIFAAVHWPQIAGPAEDFPREAQWSRELITLPCDHRYGAAEMTRIADTVSAILA